MAEVRLPLVKKEQLADKTYAFYFDKKNVSFDFIAGQYIRLILPHKNPDERGTTRFFSIAISPENPKFLRIITKITPDSSTFKKALLNLTEETELTIAGPMGKFFLKEEDKEYVFLVGGIGITPILSILEYIDDLKISTKITVLLSFSKAEEVVLKDYLEGVATRNQNLKVVYTITHPEDSKIPWKGETGRIDEEKIKKYVPDSMKPYFYVVGPPNMVEAMLGMVNSLGVIQEKIVKESFTGY